jgi:hypothetical protein
VRRPTLRPAHQRRALVGVGRRIAEETIRRAVPRAVQLAVALLSLVLGDILLILLFDLLQVFSGLCASQYMRVGHG